MSCTPDTPCPAHAPQDLTQESIFSVKPAAAPLPAPVVLGPWFSPHGGCTDAIVAQIAKANYAIHVQAYGFTSQAIFDALRAAHGKGVDVRGIFDHRASLEASSLVAKFAAAGIPTWTDGAHAIAHNKLVIFDADYVFTGSFNLTAAAEAHNAENGLIVHDKALAAKYLANWNAHLIHSMPVRPGAASAAAEGVTPMLTPEERDELAA